MNARLGLIGIVVAHFVLGLVYAWATPIFEASDEGHHVGVIVWLREGHGLPVQDPTRDREHPTSYAQEGSQPPLYYMLGWLTTAWLPAGDFEIAHTPNPLSRVGNPLTTHNPNLYRPQAVPGETWTLTMALRVLSLLMSCGTVALSAVLAARLTRDDRLALLTAAFVAFTPMVLFINASANNDNLVMLLNTATLVVLAEVWFVSREQPTVWLVGLGLLLGSAALTKLNGLVLWPIAGLVLAVRAFGGPEWPRGRWRDAWVRLWAGLRGRAAWIDLLRHGLIVFAIATAIAGWWYVRNWLLYGEWFGTETMVAIAGPRSIGLIDLITQEWYGFFLSYWGVFGGFTILGPEWVNTIFVILTLGAVVGGAWALFESARHEKRRLASPGRGFGLLLVVFIGVTLIALIRWTQQTYASQGRLMFGAIAPLSMALAFGWLFVARRLRFEPAAWLAPVTLAAVALFLPVAVIAPRYRPPAVVAEADLPADLQRLDVRLGDGLDLIGYTYDGDPHRPGGVASFTLYWRAAAPLAHDDALALVAYGRDEAVLGKIDTWPGGGLLPAANLEPGLIYADPYRLPLTDTAEAPTLLTLRVGLWREVPEGRLPTTTTAGTPIPDPALVIGRLLAQTPEAAPAGLAGAGVSWGGIDPATASIRLLGGALSSDGALTLWWEGGGTPADATLFVHLLDSTGAQLDQADGPALGGAWPLTAWVAGQPFSDIRRFNSVTTPLAGAYTLRLGWYDPATGQRLPAWRPDGARWADDAALIEITP